ncbi:uncharacterized protein LOC143922880 isoform X2 [Arctopsyche grandis]|uniref:uncharacterized protein LOC143922880 isoform X2 n=1 Tax=Arctopsyche grandis TaxID=121162 RepID=UPI00406D6536
MKWIVLALLLLSIVFTVSGDGEIWEDEDHGEVLIRNERGAKDKDACRYKKGEWSECDFKSNMRSRTLTLKNGGDTCEPTKLIQKKCKRACRYEKSPWSQCKENGEMTRTDILKANSDASCEPNRLLTKKCTGNKPAKNNKDKGSRRNRQ